jgi:hypothetical protein
MFETLDEFHQEQEKGANKAKENLIKAAVVLGLMALIIVGLYFSVGALE